MDETGTTTTDAERDEAAFDHFTETDEAAPAGLAETDPNTPTGRAHRALHDADIEAAPVFAYEHPKSGRLVLDETAELNDAGIAITREGVPTSTPHPA